MPSIPGTVNDFAGLLAVLQAGCTANGWTLTGDVLHKGAAYVRAVAGADQLSIQGGTGLDGGGLLTGAASNIGRIVQIGGQAVTFPAAYELHVHADPDEVYLVINYSAEFWQWVAFGVSDVQGLPGTGLWFGGSAHNEALDSGLRLTPTGGGFGPTSQFNNRWTSAALFFDDWNLYSNAAVAASIHHGLDERAWSGRYGDATGGNQAHAALAAAPRYARQPSTVNGAAALLDFKVWVRRPDSKVSLVADFAHARLVRIDNLDPGEVVPDGLANWRAYPWYRKNAAAAARDGGSGLNHSGTLGWAIRYDP